MTPSQPRQCHVVYVTMYVYSQIISGEATARCTPNWTKAERSANISESTEMYEVGDILVFVELISHLSKKITTGRVAYAKINNIMSGKGYGVPDDVCILVHDTARILNRFSIVNIPTYDEIMTMEMN